MLSEKQWRTVGNTGIRRKELTKSSKSEMFWQVFPHMLAKIQGLTHFAWTTLLLPKDHETDLSENNHLNITCYYLVAIV